jgi:hypothetical protein
MISLFMLYTYLLPIVFSRCRTQSICGCIMQCSYVIAYIKSQVGKAFGRLRHTSTAIMTKSYLLTLTVCPRLSDHITRHHPAIILRR